MKYCEFYLYIPLFLLEILFLKDHHFQKLTGSQFLSNAYHHLYIISSPKLLIPIELFFIKLELQCLLLKSCEFYLHARPFLFDLLLR